MKVLITFALTIILVASVIRLLPNERRVWNEAAAASLVSKIDARRGNVPNTNPLSRAVMNSPGLPQPASSGLQSGNPTNASGRTRETTAPATGAVTNSPPATLAWDPDFLNRLRSLAAGSPIKFGLPGGRTARGKIDRLEYSGDDVGLVSGQLSQPESGRFFFQKQTRPGVAGAFAGVVELAESRKAYRIEPSGPEQASEIVERPLGSVLCLDLPRPAAGDTGDSERTPQVNSNDSPTAAFPDYQNGIIVLESLPGSAAVVFLDFQAGYTPSWGGISYQRSSFGNEEILDVWKQVAEDFMPFNINITTDLQVFQNAPENSRQRVIITPTDTAAPGAGGVAYVSSFNWTGDTPCWVFVTENSKYCGQACSHEAGHTLGLVHDGQTINGAHLEYYAGHGDGDTSWAPIMGLAYFRNVTQWSKGEYIDANNAQPQIAIIATQNNVHYRADDTGDTLATSRYLEIYDEGTAEAEGVIEAMDDVDAFQFTTSGGDVSLRADPASVRPNLAVQVSLYDANDTLVASDNPQTTLWASISTNLSPGTYTFRVAGAGRNDPLTTGFSAYDSLGCYSITGTVANARRPDRFVIPENLPNGTTVGVIPPNSPNGDPHTYTITSGNVSNAFALDNSGTLSVANSAALDYEALARSTQRPVQFEMFVNIADAKDSSLNETHRRVVVGVTNVNEPPVISGFATWASSPGIGQPSGRIWGLVSCLGGDCSFASSVPEHSPPGTAVGTVIASDPDFDTLLSYSIVAGNSNGMFNIDDHSGAITVAGDPIAANQNLYQLLVVVSDQTTPVSLTATAMVTLNVQLPYPVGSISYAVYTNIAGTLVSELTNDISFPYDPAFEEQAVLFERNSNEEDGFGAVVRGYLLPPATGSYTFWIASQDNSELWLGSSTNPAGVTRIAHLSGEGSRAGPGEWTKYPTQQSAPVSLAAGYAYYIEARLKAGTASNYLAVAWECASNGLARQVIPGQYLAPYFVNYTPHPMGFTGNLPRNAVTGAQVGLVAVADVNGGDVETLSIRSGNEDGLFSLDPATGIIRLVSDTALLAASRTNYTLEVQATDNGTPPLSGIATLTINIVPTDTIVTTSLVQEIWTNISGASVFDLTSQMNYPNRPDALRVLDGFDSGTADRVFFEANDAPSLRVVQPVGSAYGSRIRAYLTPPETGLYTFFISSRDESRLLFSFTTNAADASIIAYLAGESTDYHEWTRYDSQQSGGRWLVAGNQYYLESVHKADGPVTGVGTGLWLGPLLGMDHVSVAWTGPGITGTNVIASSFLAPVDLEYPPALAGGSVKLPITATNGSLVTTLAATDSRADALAYKIVSGNTGGTFAIDPPSGRLTVEDNTLFADGSATNFNLVIEVQDSGYGGLFPLQSTQAGLSVLVVDTTPPFLWTGIAGDGNWSSDGNWNPGTPPDNARLAFTGPIGRTNRNDLLTAVGPVAINGSGFFIQGNPLVLQAGLSSRGNNTWGTPSTLGSRQTFTNFSGTLVLAGSLDNNGYDLTTIVNGTLRLDGALSGTGGLFKSGTGRLVMTASNTYEGPTVISAGMLALTNSGSLAASTRIDIKAGAVLDSRGATGGFTVSSRQTLQGLGIVLGPVTVNGTLSPDISAPGIALTFSNRLALAGNTILQLGQPVSDSWAAMLRVVGELNLGGTLTISNSSRLPRLNDTFKLFNAAQITGSFDNLHLPPLGIGLLWDTHLIASDGTIRVAMVPLQMIPVTVSSGGLTIRFQTATGLHYVLESTTDLGESVSWTTVTTYTGTGTTKSILVPWTASVPQRFLRIRIY